MIDGFLIQSFLLCFSVFKFSYSIILIEFMIIFLMNSLVLAWIIRTDTSICSLYLTKSRTYLILLYENWPENIIISEKTFNFFFFFTVGLVHLWLIIFVESRHWNIVYSPIITTDSNRTKEFHLGPLHFSKSLEPTMY